MFIEFHEIHLDIKFSLFIDKKAETLKNIVFHQEYYMLINHHLFCFFVCSNSLPNHNEQIFLLLKTSLLKMHNIEQTALEK